MTHAGTENLGRSRRPASIGAPAALVLGPLLALLAVPPALAGQASEEQRYAPAEVLGCDVGFAVFASVEGEPRAVRRCPRPDGRDAYFAPGPVVDATHVDSVGVSPADAGPRQVVVLLTEAGAREMGGLVLADRVGVVVGGEVVAELAVRAARASRRLVVLERAPVERAEAVAARIRRAVDRADPGERSTPGSAGGPSPGAGAAARGGPSPPETAGRTAGPPAGRR